MPSAQVLRNRSAVDEAAEEARRRNLPPATDYLKHWDNLLAVDALAETTGPVADLGCRSGQLLMWLYHLGRRELYGCDLRRPWPPAKKALQQGQLRTAAAALRMYLANGRNMRRARAESTGFPTGAFGAVASMSVIEHHVDTPQFFAEAARLLRPGGRLVVSTDFWPDGGETESGVIFSTADIERLLAEAESAGFEAPERPLDLDDPERVIRGYTFLFLEFDKPAEAAAANGGATR
jgi:SAM-dependent methyltransferase